MFCSGCGAQVDDTQRFCARCGTPNRGLPAAPAAAPVQPYPVQQVILVKPKDPGLAAVLSFFVTGLGQIYNGEVGKGIGFMIAYVISWCLIFVVIGIISTPILWIFGMVDAYQTAVKINAGSGIR